MSRPKNYAFIIFHQDIGTFLKEEKCVGCWLFTQLKKRGVMFVWTELCNRIEVCTCKDWKIISCCINFLNKYLKIKNTFTVLLINTFSHQNNKINRSDTYLSLHDRSNLVRDTQLPSTKLPFITVGTAHVRQATYKAHANQCKLSP